MTGWFGGELLRPLVQVGHVLSSKGLGGAGLGWVVCRGISGNYVDLGSFETMREEVDHPRRKTFARYRTMASTSM